MTKFNTPQEALRHHVTGAIERGEAVAIVGQPSEKQERWAFSESELDNPGALTSADELVASGIAEVGVVVYRNGEVSNRYGDGIAGVTKAHREEAEAEDTLHHLEVGEDTHVWKDVIVTDAGAFIRFA